MNTYLDGRPAAAPTRRVSRFIVFTLVVILGIGGVFEVVVHGLPIGLGSYVHWDRRLDAALAAAVMSINIVKGVEFGLGFEQTRRFGSAVHDVIEGRTGDGRWVHRSNNAGGLTGGVTNGEPLVVRGAVKPISTLARPLPSADLISGETPDPLRARTTFEYVLRPSTPSIGDR